MVLRKAGSLVYVGSTSRIINSVHRVGIAAINPITGQLLPFNPLRDESLYIYWLDIVVNTMCIEGEFTSFQGQNRNYLASLDLIIMSTLSKLIMMQKQLPPQLLHQHLRQLQYLQFVQQSR